VIVDATLSLAPGYFWPRLGRVFLFIIIITVIIVVIFAVVIFRITRLNIRAKRRLR
jgi:ABC-type transport system involved in Fe-S cluster assembly fused permease/ATPase subunit